MATYTTRKGELDAVQFKVPERMHRGIKSVLKRLENGDYERQ
ncbi:hypothetical protein [Solibacillus ferritrahens]